MMTTARITDEPEFHQLPHSMSLRVMPTIETSDIVDSWSGRCYLKMAQQNLRVWIPADERDENVLIEMCSETGGIWKLIGSYNGKNPPEKVQSGHLRIYCEWRFGGTTTTSKGKQTSLELVWQVKP